MKYIITNKDVAPILFASFSLAVNSDNTYKTASEIVAMTL